jgi:hypothetical protein
MITPFEGASIRRAAHRVYDIEINGSVGFNKRLENKAD